MIIIKKYLLRQFEDNIENEGFFWRITRPDTFVDLLMLQAGKASQSGIDNKLAIQVIIIAAKALINAKLGIKDYRTDHRQLNKEFLDEQEMVLYEVDSIISDGLLKSEERLGTLPLSDDLNYFKVLNNLEINNYSSDVFENVLITFLRYIRSKDRSIDL